ncbi:hypothetical protein [Treponema sp. R6D11]
MKKRAYKVCRISFFLLLLLIPIFQLSAVNFSGLTVSNDDRLLFKADFQGQHAVFVTRLNDMLMQQLTMHPEKLYLVDNGKTIIALNRLGAATIPVAGGASDSASHISFFCLRQYAVKRTASGFSRFRRRSLDFNCRADKSGLRKFIFS